MKTYQTYLNIGCGDTFSPMWTNIDLDSNSEYVKGYNIKKGLPFANESFEAVYHSHVLEHLNIDEAKLLLSEISRILKPNGFHRIVVPDLEQMVKSYLSTLEKNESSKHKWMVIELFDQMTREKSGGQMAELLLSSNQELKDFIKNRIGQEAEKIWSPKSQRSPTFMKVISKIVTKLQKDITQTLVYLVGGQKYRTALSEGLFRQEGEIHKWCYDRLSLKDLLALCDFDNIRVVTAFDSEIPNFKSFDLDTVKDQIRKPDSLFMECRKGP